MDGIGGEGGDIRAMIEPGWVLNPDDIVGEYLLGRVFGGDIKACWGVR